MMHLTKNECAAMRGLAILGIMLHNYTHWLSMAVKENEYTFTQGNANGIWHALCNPTWDLPIHLLSFFGHYGVPVFLFLSAYGLTMKYERGGAEDKVWAFLKKHFEKLFSMMIVGFAAFTMIDQITPGRHHYELLDVVAQLGMFNNLLPEPDRIIWPGPYWFFGLMMQLYIVYRLLLYKRHWSITLLLMVACTIWQMTCEPESEYLNRLRYNFIGGMMPFGLGLLFGRFQEKVKDEKWRNVVIALSAIFFTLMMSMSYELWFFVPAVICVLSVALVKITPAGINDVLAWVGGISSAIFVCHPITRKIFIPISRHGDVYAGLMLYIVATIILAMIFKRIMEKR